mmetsp:Transcript_9304/g.20707  ORF Transcript_9304/g.20707 Transcript_9304/m.20707 type:complete len:96 (-) Transcript_9304:64-351(-)
MPMLLLPVGAVPSRRSYAEQTAERQSKDWADADAELSQLSHDGAKPHQGAETPSVTRAPRARPKRSVSVTFGDVDVVCYSSEEPSESDGEEPLMT